MGEGLGLAATRAVRLPLAGVGMRLTTAALPDCRRASSRWDASVERSTSATLCSVQAEQHVHP